VLSVLRRVSTAPVAKSSRMRALAWVGDPAWKSANPSPVRTPLLDV
jgi:hypothetical protein